MFGFFSEQQTSTGDDSMDDVFNHSLVGSPLKGNKHSTPNSSPESSPGKQGQGGETAKPPVSVPSGQEDSGKVPSAPPTELDDSSPSQSETNTQPVAMETDTIEGSDVILPSNGQSESSVEENRAQHYSQSSTTGLSANSAPETSHAESMAESQNGATSSAQCDKPNLDQDNCNNNTKKQEHSDSLPAEQGASSNSSQSDLGNVNNNLGNDSSSALESDSSISASAKSEGSSNADRPTSLAVEDFNQFAYWRDPLPDIDIEAELSPTSQEAADKAAAALEEAGACGPAGSSSEDPVVAPSDISVELDPAAKAIEILSLNNGNSALDKKKTGEEAEAGNQGAVHMASVSVVTDAHETVANIGSTHVLGQALSETTMTVINGVVRGNYKEC